MAEFPWGGSKDDDETDAGVFLLRVPFFVVLQGNYQENHYFAGGP